MFQCLTINMLLGKTLGYFSLEAQLSLDTTSCSKGYFNLAFEKDPERLLTGTKTFKRRVVS